MPSARPSASRAGLRSTPTIWCAPAMRAPCTTLSPMPPRPNTTTLAPGLDLRGPQHGADAGGDAAADVADLVERRVRAHLGQRDLGQHGVVREGRAAHVVVDLLAAQREATRCRRASRPCPGSRGSRCTGWSCATGTTCTRGTRACRAAPHDRRARAMVTPAPTSTTTPAPSWPKITGNRPSGSPPERVNSSVWQTPVALISTSTSPARGPSRSTSSITSGSPARWQTAALVFMRRMIDATARRRGPGAARRDRAASSSASPSSCAPPWRDRGWPSSRAARPGSPATTGRSDP